VRKETKEQTVVVPVEAFFNVLLDLFPYWLAENASQNVEVTQREESAL
jgi:hypothetical protein